MTYESPRTLLSRLKLGREEFCQRLLTMLILGAPYPRWNTRHEASPRGERFLESLYRLSFDPDSWPGHGLFVDELDMPARHEDEKGCAPDQAVLWSNGLWMIELKTETKSHRPKQIPSYFEFAHHHYPGCFIDLTYLTPPLKAPFSPTGVDDRYSHVTWIEVAELIREVWGSTVAGDERELVQGLLDAIKNMLEETPSELRARVTGLSAASLPQEELREHQVQRVALALAKLTAADGKQRAVDYRASDLEELQALRLVLRDSLCSGPEGSELRYIRPWLWRFESGGDALTDAGAELGYELRLSRYERTVC
jgi:hypothetical protein